MTPAQQGVLNVKSLLARATVVASTVVASIAFFSLVAPSVHAQTRRPAASESGVRVIDINKIFKNHKYFKAELEKFRTYVTTIEAELREKRKVVEGLQKRLAGLKPSSPEAKALETEIVNAKGKFNAEATLKRKDLLEREARIYYLTYYEIQKEVDYYCQVKNVGLVIRYNSETVNKDDRTSVMRQVANPIVVQRHIDITDTILRVLNGRPGSPPSNPNVGRAPGGRLSPR